MKIHAKRGIFTLLLALCVLAGKSTVFAEALHNDVIETPALAEAETVIELFPDSIEDMEIIDWEPDYGLYPTV